MTFSAPPSGTETNLAENLFQASLPEASCAACGGRVERRTDRVMIRASWRPAQETLCVECWDVICEWAARFALQQLELPLV